MSATSLYDQLFIGLQTAADPVRAQKMSAYMRDQFPFLGVMAPERKAIVKDVIRWEGRPTAADWPVLSKRCFAPGVPRELQYALGDIFIPLKNRMPETAFPRIEELVLTTSWWDTVDWLVPHLAAAILQRDPQLMESVTRRWIESDNIWLQRSALIFQLHYKRDTRPDLLFAYVKRRAASKEFFVQKGAGWALRQYSKIAPQEVADFIQQTELSPLTVREGEKLLRKQGLL